MNAAKIDDSDMNSQESSPDSQTEDLTEEELDQIEIDVEPGAAIRKMQQLAQDIYESTPDIS
jgi:hypothetical protein